MTKRCRSRIAETMRSTAAAWGLVGVIVSPGAPTPRIVSPGAPTPRIVSPGAPSPRIVSPGAPSPRIVSPGARSPRIVTVGAGRPFRCVELVQQPLDTVLAGDRFVVVELELRR